MRVSETIENGSVWERHGDVHRLHRCRALSNVCSSCLCRRLRQVSESLVCSAEGIHLSKSCFVELVRSALALAGVPVTGYWLFRAQLSSWWPHKQESRTFSSKRSGAGLALSSCVTSAAVHWPTSACTIDSGSCY